MTTTTTTETAPAVEPLPSTSSRRLSSAKAIAADDRAYERTVRDRQGFAQQERSEQEAFLRERERQKALHQMFGKKVSRRCCILVREGISRILGGDLDVSAFR